MTDLGLWYSYLILGGFWDACSAPKRILIWPPTLKDSEKGV